MTIEELGSLGELIAAIATVATLLYLSLQIRANTRALKSESYGRLSSQANDFSAALANNRETAEVFSRGIADYDSLDQVDKTRFANVFAMLMNVTDTVVHEHQLGLGDDAWLESQTSSALQLLKTPGGRAWWRRFGHTASPAFLAYVSSKAGIRAPKPQAGGDADD